MVKLLGTCNAGFSCVPTATALFPYAPSNFTEAQLKPALHVPAPVPASQVPMRGENTQPPSGVQLPEAT